MKNTADEQLIIDIYDTFIFKYFGLSLMFKFNQYEFLFMW